MSTISWKRGDYGDPVVVELRNDGTVADLTEATGAVLHFRPKGRTGPHTTQTCAIQSPRTAGRVEWVPASGLLDDVGTYEWEIEVTWPDRTRTYPSAGYGLLVVRDDVD